VAMAAQMAMKEKAMTQKAREHTNAAIKQLDMAIKQLKQLNEQAGGGSKGHEAEGREADLRGRGASQRGHEALYALNAAVALRKAVEQQLNEPAAVAVRGERGMIKTLLQESRASRPVSQVPLPSAAQFVIILLSRQRRDDVLNDLCDWADHDGRFSAKCWVRLISALFGQVLDVLYRIGEVVGKFRGAK